MKRVLFCKRKQGKTNHKSNYLRNPLMHYTLSHPPRFLLPGMTIFKMTLKIRVATKKMPARGFAPDWHFLFKKTFLFVDVYKRQIPFSFTLFLYIFNLLSTKSLVLPSWSVQHNSRFQTIKNYILYTIQQSFFSSKTGQIYSF